MNFFAKFDLNAMLERAKVEHIKKLEDDLIHSTGTFASDSPASVGQGLTFEKLKKTIDSIPPTVREYILELDSEFVRLFFAKHERRPPYPWGSMFLSHRTAGALNELMLEAQPGRTLIGCSIYTLGLQERMDLFHALLSEFEPVSIKWMRTKIPVQVKTTKETLWPDVFS